MGLAGIGGDGFRVEGGGVDVHAAARLERIRHDQADGERQRADDFEVDECLEADAAELAGVANAGDAGDDGEEDDGGDHHADELDEAIAEGAHGLAEMGRKDAGEHAGRDADEDTEIKGSVERLGGLDFS